MKMKENWKKQFQNSFETVPKLFCVSLGSVSFQLCGQFNLMAKNARHQIKKKKQK